MLLKSLLSELFEEFRKAYKDNYSPFSIPVFTLYAFSTLET